MRQSAQLSGQRFGFLVVLGESAEPGPRPGKWWECRCDCGKIVLCDSTRLTRGLKRGCGCILTRSKADLTGQRFGRLVAIARSGSQVGQQHKWVCRCDCGEEAVVVSSKLRGGTTKSCGCLNSDRLRERNATHGMSKTSEWRIWAGMKIRCLNPNCPAYKHYGGRGIRVCNRWLESFENFYEDMGPRPSKKHSLDRRDNDKGYSKENCRWATRLEQASNTRAARLITVDGKTNTLQGWARDIGVNVMTIHQRLANGWSEEDAMKPAGWKRKRQS